MSTQNSAMADLAPSPSLLRIAVVGDVHDEWDPVKDLQALRALKPDVVLFVGDFGNSNVDLVRDVSKLDFPKAVILGNHDCWRTVSPVAQDDASERNAVEEQLDMLGDAHVGFGRLDFPDLRLSVVGGRPFSMGGDRIHGLNKFLVPRYGVHNFRESADRIVANATEAPQDNFLVFLAHNGPRGLGSKGEDICGRDWYERGGDHGDPDLEEAIAAVKQEGIIVPLVVFGHMHERLPGHGSLKRTMLVVRDNTIYLNAAVVPRVREITDPGRATLTQRHFALVDLHNSEVESIYEVWVTVGDEEDCEVTDTLMFSRPGTAPLE